MTDKPYRTLEHTIQDLARKAMKDKMDATIKLKASDLPPEDDEDDVLPEGINEAEGTGDYKKGKMFAHLDDSHENHKLRMVHSVTAYDRGQAEKAAKNPKKSHYNHYALGHYLAAADRAHADMKKGVHPGEAINKHFNGALAKRLHKHLATGHEDTDTVRKRKFNEEAVKPIAEGHNLYKYNKRSGYWDHQRSVNDDNKDQWLSQFKKDEPSEHFVVSKKRPNHNPTLKKEEVVDEGHLEKADHHTNDVQDAHDTAKQHLKEEAEPTPTQKKLEEQRATITKRNSSILSLVATIKEDEDSPAGKAHRAWRSAVDKGYGDKTTPVDMERIDARIRRLKEKHDALVKAAKEPK